MAVPTRTARRLPVLISTLALTTLLGACSSDDDNGSAILDDPAGDDRPGLVVGDLNGSLPEDLVTPFLANIQLFQNPAFTDASGMSVRLLRDEEGLTVDGAIDFYAPELDTCTLIDLSPAEGGGEGGGGDANNRLVSGGSSLTINQGSGPWLVIFRPNLADVGQYQSLDGQVAAIGALPEDATLSIPGDVFPNVPAFPLTEQPPSPVRLTPAAGMLTENDIVAPFTWEPLQGLAGGFIEIVGRAFDLDGNFVGFAARCDVVDDGEFSLPADLVAAFRDSPDLQFDVRYQRVVGRLDFSNGILFRQEFINAE